MQDVRKKLMYKVAKAYYEDNLTQQVIGKKYGISRIMVSRLLKRAIQEKMVEIKIVQPADPNIDLEKLLEKKFGLQEVLVVSNYSDNYQDILAEIGAAAALWLVNHLDGTETIALSWGESLLSLVNSLSLLNYPELKVVQMIGGLGEPGANVHGADLTRRMAQSFNGKPLLLSSPGIVKSKSICDALKSDRQISENLKLAAKADIAIMGIGAFTRNAKIFSTNIILSERDKKYLLEKEAIADISLRFFNSNGEMIEGDINDRIVGLEFNEIQKLPRRIGIAGGSHKLKPIYAACKGKLINVLITDEDNAKKLLKLD
jgi:DNA-binding transcriptional regulator LsrR (DeoR family)